MYALIRNIKCVLQYNSSLASGTTFPQNGRRPLTLVEHLLKMSEKLKTSRVQLWQVSTSKYSGKGPTVMPWSFVLSSSKIRIHRNSSVLNKSQSTGCCPPSGCSESCSLCTSDQRQTDQTCRVLRLVLPLEPLVFLSRGIYLNVFFFFFACLARSLRPQRSKYRGFDLDVELPMESESRESGKGGLVSEWRDI